MRLPRKLKKGCRTLNGNPRTKWQRKGRLHIAKMLNDVANYACAAAVGMELLQKAAEKINPIALPSGGFVVPSPPKGRCRTVSTGEMVLNREQVARLTSDRDKMKLSVSSPGSISTTKLLEAIKANENRDYGFLSHNKKQGV